MYLRDPIIPVTQGGAAELVTQDQKNWLLLREPTEDERAGQEEVRGWGSSHWDPNQWLRSAFHTHAVLRHHSINYSTIVQICLSKEHKKTCLSLIFKSFNKSRVYEKRIVNTSAKE